MFTAILIHENAPLDLTLVKITEILTIVNGENSFKGYRLLTDIFNGKIGEKYIKNVGKLDERIDEKMEFLIPNFVKPLRACETCPLSKKLSLKMNDLILGYVNATFLYLNILTLRFLSCSN